jgi:hypothetical protein
MSAREALVARQRMVTTRTEQESDILGKPRHGQRILNRLHDERRNVESMVASPPNISALVSEYCDLKYSGLKCVLSRCVRLNREMKSQFRQLKFVIEVAALESKMSAFAESFRELVRELDQTFIRPRRSARNKVNNVVMMYIDIDAQYADLQERFRKYFELNSIILRDLDRLAHDFWDVPPERRMLYRELRHRVYQSGTTFNRAAHEFRTYHLLRQDTEAPFAASWYIRLLYMYGVTSRQTKLTSRAWRRSVEALLSPISKKCFYAHLYESEEPWAVPVLMHQFYMRRLEKPDSHGNPELNIFWRQLDVLAPFELFWSGVFTLSCEVSYLRATLLYTPAGLWSNLSQQACRTHYDRFKKFSFDIENLRAEINKLYGLYRAFNWMRLQSETRLCRLGEPAFTCDRGLFTVWQPLSQNIDRFREWVYHLNRDISTRNILQIGIQECLDAHRDLTKGHLFDDQGDTPEGRCTFSEIDPLQLESEPEPETQGTPSPSKNTASCTGQRREGLRNMAWPLRQRRVIRQESSSLGWRIRQQRKLRHYERIKTVRRSAIFREPQNIRLVGYDKKPSTQEDLQSKAAVHSSRASAGAKGSRLLIKCDPGLQYRTQLRRAYHFGSSRPKIAEDSHGPLPSKRSYTSNALSFSRDPPETPQTNVRCHI